ncbi:hypothetical protein JYP52_01585 [Nitratireductor aquibiodomus]|uniref:ATP-dependent DNA ligase n=1 Tax=Nitratireductor aquibiodomus TaxID=204799 RepID=UPI0019D39467|nr:hypothetical protein [Nitratireductor aquibiodomus]MBN7759815.1 hypothetical protein [Nitratireductor aquibiodomus]
MNISEPIFKRDTQGRLRSWYYEVDGNRWRSTSGLVDGAQTTTEWTVCEAKSQDTDEAQARFEAEAERRKKLERQYHLTPEACDTPNFFEPMLAKTFKAKGQTFPVANQPKLDGIRCVARAEGLFTRQGKPIVSCPHIEEELKPYFEADPDLILDGELYNHELKANFEKLVSAIRKQKPNPETAGVVEYHIYDVPSLDGSFNQRAAVVDAMFSQCKHLRSVETRLSFDQQGLDRDYEDFLEQGYEGQMVRLDVPYEAGKRSKALLKRKEFTDAEFQIVDVIEGKGNWSGYAKRLTVALPDGRTFGAGVAGTQDFCRKLLADREKWIGRLATVKFFTPTSDGIPRFPVAIKFHEGDRL